MNNTKNKQWNSKEIFAEFGVNPGSLARSPYGILEVGTIVTESANGGAPQLSFYGDDMEFAFSKPAMIRCGITPLDSEAILCEMLDRIKGLSDVLKISLDQDTDTKAQHSAKVYPKLQAITEAYRKVYDTTNPRQIY